jgi:hypothetical protein
MYLYKEDAERVLAKLALFSVDVLEERVMFLVDLLD